MSASATTTISSEQPWTSWLMDHGFSFESQALTQALQFSLSTDSSSNEINQPPPAAAAAAAAAATSDPCRELNPITGPKVGKVGKRKSRAKKRTPTTYINAEPENFRAMVQMMTGGGGFGLAAVEPVIRPEPRRQGFVPGSVGVRAVAGPAAEEMGFLRFPTLESWGMMV